MITWILDKHVDRVRGAPTPFIEEAEKRGHKVYGLRDSIIPKSIDLTGVEISEHTIIRGSHGFVSYVQKELNPTPGSFLHSTNFQLSVYAPIIGDFNLNNDFQIVEYGYFRQNRKDFKGNIFVKPLDEIKKFTGIILEDGQDLEAMHLEKYGKWYSPHCGVKIVIASIKEIISEYRVIVIDGKAITGSSYDCLTCPPEDVIETASIVANIWNPVDVYVIDIAQTPNGNKVVEYNQFSTSAIYACDQEKIVDALEQYLSC